MTIAIQTKIAGVKFRDIEAQVRANRLEPRERLTLVPEPDNKYDEHAVKVLTHDGIFLGYVPRVFSAQVAKAITSGTTIYCAAGDEPLEIELESIDVNEPSE